MSEPLRVFEIEARTRYRIAAHSAHDALERLHELDACTRFGERPGRSAEIPNGSYGLTHLFTR